MGHRILVVCYSRSGTALRVAKHLSAALGADLDPIEELGSRKGLGGYLRSAWEAIGKGLPTIRTRKDPRDYDFVVLATPVWVGTMCSPMRSYLHAHAGALRNVAFFAVMGGRGGDDTVREMQMQCGVAEAATCVLTQHEVERGDLEQRCASFVRAIRAAVDSLDGATRSAAA